MTNSRNPLAYAFGAAIKFTFNCRQWNQPDKTQTYTRVRVERPWMIVQKAGRVDNHLNHQMWHI